MAGFLLVRTNSDHVVLFSFFGPWFHVVVNYDNFVNKASASATIRDLDACSRLILGRRRLRVCVCTVFSTRDNKRQVQSRGTTLQTSGSGAHLRKFPTPHHSHVVQRVELGCNELELSGVDVDRTRRFSTDGAGSALQRRAHRCPWS